MIEVKLENVHSRIIGYLPEPIVKELSDSMSYSIPNAYFIPSVRDNKWDGVIRLFNKSEGQRFYTGLWSFVRECFKKNGVDYFVTDLRERPDENMQHLTFTPFDGYEEREYQKFTIERAYKFTRGIFQIATGGGKTNIATELLAKIKTGPAIFYVPTKDLLEQTREAFQRVLNVPIGAIGGGYYEIQNINIMTFASAIYCIKAGDANFDVKSYVFDDEDKSAWKDEVEIEPEKKDCVKKLISSSQVVMFDECHHAASKTVLDILTFSKKAFWRYGFSATPYRESNDEILIQAMFGSIIVDISASYLIKNGYLLKPYIFFVPYTPQSEYRTYAKIYDDSFTNNDEYNFFVADLNKYLNDKKLKTIVLVQRVEHGNAIKRKSDEMGNVIEFLHGKLNKKKRKKYLDDLRSGEVISIAATTLADEGLDIPTLNGGIMAGGGKSQTRVLQRVGRVIRIDRKTGKKVALFFIFQPKIKFLQTHANRAIALLKEEEEFVVIKSKGFANLKNEIDHVLDCLAT
jgi:superfamily II DNA or RNA helicase